MQSLPSIRLVQENDKSLITKINSTLANTVPLWRQQLARRSPSTARARRRCGQGGPPTSPTSFWRRMPTTCARVNAEVRQQVERGVFDIEVVKRANDQLIATIEDSLRIADEGKAKRREGRAAARRVRGEDEGEPERRLGRAAGKAPPAARRSRPETGGKGRRHDHGKALRASSSTSSSGPTTRPTRSPGASSATTTRSSSAPS